MNGIIELRQVGENDWKAKYQGNYGIYSIKITVDGNKAKKFSCSCPSDYYPCKHIPIVERAIAEQMAFEKKFKKAVGLSLDELIKNVSAEKLRDFIVTQAKYDPDFHNAVLLEFAANAGSLKSNIYSGIIQKALAAVTYDEEAYYYLEEYQEIEVLDQWLGKAQDYVGSKQYAEAVFICTAIIEEYSQWLYNIGEDTSMFFDQKYQTIPFKIIEDTVEYITNKKELFDYCLSEMKKEKYEGTDFYQNFHKLFAILAVMVDPDAFIAIQDELLAGIKDKGSHGAEIILRRKINFYRRIDQPKMAWALIKENIQIEAFRLKVVKMKIKKQKFAVAKKLINNFVNRRKKDANRYLQDIWGKLLLDIAQKENDIPAIRELAYGFIKNNFKEKYFAVYKAAFGPDEWNEEREKLLLHYSEGYFNSSVADFLVVEKDKIRLMEYMEKYLSIDELEKYYKFFASDYPEKTLGMFKKALVRYAEENVGRSHYERILLLLRKMYQVKGGKKAAMELVAEFRLRYKTRRAMMEVLSNFT